jgi:predicted component of type VI protein secretion system
VYYNGGRDMAFRILVCGDFSGRAAKALEVMRLDVDNVDRSMRRLQARISPMPLGGESGGGELAIASLDDFHPDALCRRISSLQVLCELRRRLLDPRTASETVHALAREPSGTAASTPAAAAENQDATLARLLGAPARPDAATQATAVPSLDAILQHAVAGHITPAVDPRQSDFIASVDRALAESMRRLLHAPSFQRLESAWRSLHWLVTTVGPDEELEILACDVAKHALAADLSAAAIENSETYRLLADAFPCSLIVGDYAFGPGAEDVSLLTTLAALGQALGAPFLGAADDALLGCRGPEDGAHPSAWHPLDSASFDAFRALRRSPAASFVGLTWPRWLLRSPYGAKRDPVEAFAFEELDGRPAHSSLLWGNGAFAAAAIVAEAFRENGDASVLDGPFDIGERPLYVFQENGESTMQPCVESWIGERAVEAALARGVMPMASLRGRNTVRLPRLQSIAESGDSLPLGEV